MKPRFIKKQNNISPHCMTKATLRRVSLGFTTAKGSGFFINPIRYLDNQIKYYRKEVKELNKLMDELEREINK